MSFLLYHLVFCWKKMCLRVHNITKKMNSFLTKKYNSLKWEQRGYVAYLINTVKPEFFIDIFDKLCLLGRNFYLNFCEGPTSTLLKSVYIFEGGERKMSSSIWTYNTLDSLTNCCNLDSVVTCIYNKLFKFLTDPQITLLPTSAAGRHLVHILVWFHVFRYSLTVELYM
jgi:hypothetical protein